MIEKVSSENFKFAKHSMDGKASLGAGSVVVATFVPAKGVLPSVAASTLRVFEWNPQKQDFDFKVSRLDSVLQLCAMV